MSQERLFRLAPEAVLLQCFFEPPSGWRLAVRMHRQGDPWTDGYASQYSGLTTAELVDVVCCEIGRALLIT